MAGNFLCVCMGVSAILLLSAFPIAQIALGAAYIDECPAAPAIPVYVMVSGIVALLLKLILTVPKLLCPAAECNPVWILSALVMVLFAAAWFIFGSYHIYSIYPPSYTKIAMDPNSLNSISTPTAPDNKTGPTSENQNQSIPNLSRTWTTNKNNNDHKTLMNLTETLTSGNVSGQLNLTETLTSSNVSGQLNLTETLTSGNVSGQINLTKTLTSGNISGQLNLTETLTSGNVSGQINLTETLTSGNVSGQINLTETLTSGNVSNERNVTETLASGNRSSEANREHLNAPQTQRVAAAKSYCQKILYLFAFWTTTLVYVLAGHALVIVTCVFGFMKIAEMLSKSLV